MKLSLARYNKKDTSGWWLVRELPGICVVRGGDGWMILYTGQIARAADRGVWPANEALQKRHLPLTSNSPNSSRAFRTRREALDFLEVSLQTPAESVIAEALI